VLFTIPINLFFQRRDPHQIGLNPDNASTDCNRDAQENATAVESEDFLIIDRQWAATSWTSRQALKTDRFWYLAAGFFLGPFAIRGVLLHAVAGLVDGGMSAKAAAATFGLLGVCGSVGKITLGFFGDR
jgi:hypothetical protein